MMGSGNGELRVPPGFRFHPSDEELVYYYLRKKVYEEAAAADIDMVDVIREIDLNKLEPWDLKDKCRMGCGPEEEWYFFSHKDKKYPSGSRTNRATRAGFWKATGRDKAIHLTKSKRMMIGMRKTLVFYRGRAPQGQKTDWIMHEYRLQDDNSQEHAWVVCRVFMKKNQTTTRCTFQVVEDQDHHHHFTNFITTPLHNNNSNTCSSSTHLQPLYNSTTASMHLPHLFSPDQSAPPPLNSLDLECSQGLLGLTSGPLMHPPHRTFHGGDWSFLDKLLASNHDHHHTNNYFNPSLLHLNVAHNFPLGQPDLLKFSK